MGHPFNLPSCPWICQRGASLIVIILITGMAHLVGAETGITSPSSPTAEASGLAATIASGGRVGLVIVGLSIIALAFALERAINLRRGRICPRSLPQAVQLELLNGQAERSLALATERDDTIAGRVLAAVIRHRDFAFSELSTIASDITARELRLQMNRAYPLLVVATIAPLLGLLGTVIGMIGSFKTVAMAGSMGDPSLMAEDISFALVTTAMGLVVAVPSLAAYHFMRSRTQFFSALLDEEIGDVINAWQLHRIGSIGRAPETPPAGAVSPPEVLTDQAAQSESIAGGDHAQ